MIKLETENGLLRAALAEARETIAQLRPSEPVPSALASRDPHAPLAAILAGAQPNSRWFSEVLAQSLVVRPTRNGRGDGLFTNAAIRTGTHVAIFGGRLQSEAPSDARHTLRLAGCDRFVDGAGVRSLPTTHMGAMVNSSSTPNCRLVYHRPADWARERCNVLPGVPVLVATRTIDAGEELLWRYNLNCQSQGHRDTGELEAARDDVSTDSATASTDIVAPVRKRGRPCKAVVLARPVDATAARALGPIISSEPLAEIGWQVARRAKLLRKRREFKDGDGMTELSHDSLLNLLNVLDLREDQSMLWIGSGNMTEIAALALASGVKGIRVHAVEVNSASHAEGLALLDVLGASRVRGSTDIALGDWRIFSECRDAMSVRSARSHSVVYSCAADPRLAEHICSIAWNCSARTCLISRSWPRSAFQIVRERREASARLCGSGLDLVLISGFTFDVGE